MTVDEIIDAILQNELHPTERGKPWAEVKVRQHQADKGGPTKAGITTPTLGMHRRLGRKATIAELESMTEDECRAIYRQRHVAPFEGIPSPLRELMIDWGVTSRHLAVVTALQMALRRRGTYTAQVDGIFGAQTRAALVADPDPPATYRDVLKARMNYYEDLALVHDEEVREFLRTHPTTQLANLKGWLNRARKFL